MSEAPCENFEPSQDAPVISALLYEYMHASPVREPEPAVVPLNATSAYLYSYEQNRQKSFRGDAISYFQSSITGAKIGYTVKLPLNRDFKKLYNKWKSNYPDGMIVGYRTPGTQEIHPASQQKQRDPRMIWA